MTSYLPCKGLHVILFNRDQAERWTRHVYRVPAEHGLGWRPYRVLIQSHGATAYTAFDSVKQFRRWLGEHKIALSAYRKGDWCRYGRIV